MIQLSKRLTMVGKYVPKNSRLADIGSDHAYLPIALIQEGKITFALAGEVVEGPYEHAKQMVIENNLSEEIVVRLGDGLEVIEKDDNINAITIAGMGGKLIASILDEGQKQGKLDNRPDLILQPNVDEYTVRHWLNENGYEIQDENILEENKKIYEIIYATPSNKSLEKLDENILWFGQFVEEKNPEIFAKKWQLELKKTEYILNQLESRKNRHPEKFEKFHSDAKRIKERLA